MKMLWKDDLALIDACAAVYTAAYSQPPWNENLRADQTAAYLRRYAERSGLHMYALMCEGAPAGVALCSIVPCIGGDFARIEDFCIAPDRQRMGLGTHFMHLICADLRARGCDSALLATQRDYPSHRFYLKNGFVPLDASVQLYREF